MCRCEECVTGDEREVPTSHQTYEDALSFVLVEHERFPTLYLDDCEWRGDPMGSEPPGHYDTDHVVHVPVAVAERLARAQTELRAAEDAVREYVHGA